jgi:hypothetical protein
MSFPSIRKQTYEQEHNYPSVVQYNNGNPCRPILMLPLCAHLLAYNLKTTEWVLMNLKIF